MFCFSILNLYLCKFLEKFLRDYKKSEQLKRQTNQIEEYSIYKKRLETMGKQLQNREVKKIGNGYNKQT